VALPVVSNHLPRSRHSAIAVDAVLQHRLASHPPQLNMAPFSFATFTETFLVLMNTPLVEQEADTAPRDVPLTDMPRRSGEYRERERDLRRRSNDSNASSTSQSSRSSSSDSSLNTSSADEHRGTRHSLSRPDLMVLDADSLTDALTTQLSSNASVSRFTSSRRTLSPNFSLSSKKLPPLPTHLPRNSHVHFVDDPPYGQ